MPTCSKIPNVMQSIQNDSILDSFFNIHYTLFDSTIIIGRPKPFQWENIHNRQLLAGQISTPFDFKQVHKSQIMCDI